MTKNSPSNPPSSTGITPKTIVKEYSLEGEDLLPKRQRSNAVVEKKEEHTQRRDLTPLRTLLHSTPPSRATKQQEEKKHKTTSPNNNLTEDRKRYSAISKQSKSLNSVGNKLPSTITLGPNGKKTKKQPDQYILS
jgi:hypothetical protein